MMRHKLMVLAAGSAILALASVSPVSAIDVSVGGTSVSTSGSVSASARFGETSALAMVGDEDRIAHVNLLTGDHEADVDIGTGDGPFASVGSSGNLPESSTTDADVNLGALFGLFGADEGATGGGDGAVDSGQAAEAFASLSGEQQLALKQRCDDVLRFPSAYDTELIALCQILTRL